MAETRTELQMIKMSEIQSQEVAWLWFPFIPYGKLTIVQGDPGDGKTTFVLNIAAKHAGYGQIPKRISGRYSRRWIFRSSGS